MKSIEEIRRHRNALRTLHAAPCNCAGTIHADECMKGGLMMEAQFLILSWVLGEAEHLQPVVDKLNRSASDTIGSN